jgi:hypothetical protein
MNSAMSPRVTVVDSMTIMPSQPGRLLRDLFRLSAVNSAFVPNLGMGAPDNCVLGCQYDGATGKRF